MTRTKTLFARLSIKAKNFTRARPVIKSKNLTRADSISTIHANICETTLSYNYNFSKKTLTKHKILFSDYMTAICGIRNNNNINHHFENYVHKHS